MARRTRSFLRTAGIFQKRKFFGQEVKLKTEPTIAEARKEDINIAKLNVAKKVESIRKKPPPQYKLKKAIAVSKIPSVSTVRTISRNVGRAPPQPNVKVIGATRITAGSSGPQRLRTVGDFERILIVSPTVEMVRAIQLIGGLTWVILQGFLSTVAIMTASDIEDEINLRTPYDTGDLAEDLKQSLREFKINNGTLTVYLGSSLDYFRAVQTYNTTISQGSPYVRHRKSHQRYGRSGLLNDPKATPDFMRIISKQYHKLFKANFEDRFNRVFSNFFNEMDLHKISLNVKDLFDITEMVAN